MTNEVPQWCVDAVNEIHQSDFIVDGQWRSGSRTAMLEILARHAANAATNSEGSNSMKNSNGSTFPIFSMSDVFGTTTFHQHHEGRYGSGETPRIGDIVRALEGKDGITTGDVLTVDRLIRGADDTCRWVGLKEHEGLDYFPTRFSLVCRKEFAPAATPQAASGKWPRYAKNKATPAWTASQSKDGCAWTTFLNGKPHDSLTHEGGNALIRDGVWVETDAEGNALPQPEASGVERWEIYRFNTPTLVVTAADHDMVVGAVRAELLQLLEHIRQSSDSKKLDDAKFKEIRAQWESALAALRTRAEAAEAEVTMLKEIFKPRKDETLIDCAKDYTERNRIGGDFQDIEGGRGVMFHKLLQAIRSLWCNHERRRVADMAFFRGMQASRFKVKCCECSRYWWMTGGYIQDKFEKAPTNEETRHGE